MKSLTTVLILIILKLGSVYAHADELKKRPMGVPGDAIYHNNKWYKIYLSNTPWNAAKQKCKALGGQLVVIPDEATWNFVKTIAGNARLWLGATDKKNEGFWVWVDGSLMEFAAWRQNEPNNVGGKEHYLMTFQGKWNDLSRNANKAKAGPVVGFICEWQHK